MHLLTKIAGVISIAFLSRGLAGTATSGGGPGFSTSKPAETTTELQIKNSEFLRMENRMRTLGNASIKTQSGRLDVQEFSREFFTVEEKPRRITPSRPLKTKIRVLP